MVQPEMTIHSKAANDASREGYERIWGKKEEQKPKYEVAEDPSVAPVGIEEFEIKKERLFTELKRCAKEWMGTTDLKLDATFDSLGADSLDQIEMLMDIEETFDIEVDDDTAMGWKTCQDVINYLVIHVAS
jgi:acyl carrier protein